MFRYVYPHFEKKRLLRGEMLEQLRDYPKDFIRLSFDGYGDGVVAGCAVTWDHAVLTIHPGILLYRKRVYLMDAPYCMECGAWDAVRYLKVQFLTEERGSGHIAGNTRILLDEAAPDAACEMELCRFRLQEGARLRDTYENFEDFSTAYDTVNLICAPFAAEGGSTLSPLLLRSFAGEMVRREGATALDLAFSMNILVSSGRVAAEGIREYLRAGTGERADENIEMYRGLLAMLRLREKGGTGSEAGRAGRDNRPAKSIMLL